MNFSSLNPISHIYHLSISLISIYVLSFLSFLLPSVLSLTSLYCRKTKPESLKLGFGSHQLAAGRPSPLSEGELRLEVGQIITHPQYSR